MLRLIEEDNNFSNGEVPFVSDFIKTTGKVDEASFVVSVKSSPKGLFVVCEQFKGVVFAGSKLHDFLLQACKHYLAPGNTAYALYGIACQDGKLRIACDDEYTAVSWQDKSGAYYQKKLDTEDSAATTATSSNPLIPSPPTSGSSRAKRTPRTTELPPQGQTNS